jgi:hypothetical protein
MSMSGLAELTNNPVRVTLGGREFEARALKLSEWGAIQGWYQDKIEHPLARLGKAIDQAEAWDRPLSEETIRAFYLVTCCEPFPPRIGTPEWLTGLNSVEGGVGQFVYYALRTYSPDLTVTEANEIAESASNSELLILQTVAFTGRPPLPKSEGSTTTMTSPVEPEASRNPTTPGTASSTPSAPAAD